MAEPPYDPYISPAGNGGTPGNTRTAVIEQVCPLNIIFPHMFIRTTALATPVGIESWCGASVYGDARRILRRDVGVMELYFNQNLNKRWALLCASPEASSEASRTILHCVLYCLLSATMIINIFFFHQQINETVDIMRDNINKVAERGTRLESLQDKTGMLLLPLSSM